MGTRVTSSSGSVLEELEIQKLRMQAKIFKENSLNKLNALKSTTQLLERHSILYQQAFAQLHCDIVKPSSFSSLTLLVKALSIFIQDLFHQIARSKKKSSEIHYNDSSNIQGNNHPNKKFPLSNMQIQNARFKRSKSSGTSSGDEQQWDCINERDLINRNWEATRQSDMFDYCTSDTQTDIEKYTALNDRDIVNQKHDELVKKSLLTRSQFEGQLKEKSKVISDLKVKEGKDIDTMIEMDDKCKLHISVCADKSKITRNFKFEQARTRELEEYKAKAKEIHSPSQSPSPLPNSSYNNPQGSILLFSKVLYNLKRGNEREGPNVLTSQTPTVLTDKKGAGTPFTIHRLPRFHPYGKTRGKPLRTKKIWMPKIRKEDVSTSISPTIDIVSRITNVLKISNSLGSNLSNVPSSSNSLADCTTHPIHCTIYFGNDQFALILGYGDLIQGNVMIKRVYYVEGLNHNLFSGNDLLTGNRGYDIYTISLQETTSSTPICFMAKASPTQAWLWHRRLSHLNFDYITLLSKKDIVTGLPKLTYVKDQLCSSCEMSKAKRSSFKSKAVPSSKGRLNLLHMDLCGPMRVASINGKKYILVIVDDYSRYTWTLFLRSKDETPEVLKDFLTMIQRNLQAQVISVRTDRGTKFLNKTLHAYFKEEGIEHQTSTPRTPEQNGVVERQNRTLVEAARTMLSAFKLPLSFWAEAVATACYTQNRSIIISTHGKTAYHIINDRKPSIKHLHIFGCICYITRDGENLDKMKEKGDPCVMVGYSTQSKGYRVYNKRTRLIVESIHIKFDEIKEMMSDHNSSDLAPQRQEMSVENVSSGLVPQGQKASDYDNSDPVPPRQNVVPTAEKTDSSQQGLEFLFSPLLEEYYNPAHGHGVDKQQ
ncbi:retrovirus-related pol polyprotein from transposon TNT 1-94 [Tanacetum coccineum]|uniref:Retrovirus-related pol polyprotein from transposon TNT 1-94 n=1 Tax=Tanacetum coccineum TaxID=301880 RepID=A0ABQ5GYE9_9ASTR